MADPILTPIYQEYTIDMSSNNNFVQVPSVQGDGNNTRYVRIMLVANNTQYIIPDGVNVYIAGTKPDNKNILNNCEIDEDGKILVEITSEMTSAPGKGDYQIMLLDTTTNSQLKTFPFYLITTKSFNADEIISSNEYQALTEALAKAMADYSEIMTTCEEYKNQAETFAENANASEIASKASEDNAKASEDNAKASEESASASATLAQNSASAALVSENNAKASETAAFSSENNAKASEDNAKTSEDNAKEFETNAKTSEDNAKTSEDNAKDSEDNAKESETNAKISEDNAKTSEDNAKASETAAAESAQNASASETNSAESEANAENYANLSKKWAVWEDGEQTPSGTNNARYWANKAKEWSGFDDIDATSVTYTKEDGSKVILADYLKFLEDLDGETILII